jgi:hypothetical protein
VLTLAWSAAAAPAALAAPAAPAGSRAVAGCPATYLDRYEPGDEIDMLGHTRGCIPDIAEPSVQGQPAVRAFLHPCAASGRCQTLLDAYLPDDVAGGTPLGRVTLDPEILGPRGQRMRLTFRLPDDIPPGLYLVMFCQDPCDPRLEPDPYTPVYVGVDRPPGSQHVHHWPLDEPAIADLPADALLLAHDGETITAAEVRANPATTVSAAGSRGSGGSDGGDRVELADPPTDDGGGGPGSALWIPLAALVGLAVLVVGRRMPSRKHVRPAP